MGGPVNPRMLSFALTFLLLLLHNPADSRSFPRTTTTTTPMPYISTSNNIYPTFPTPHGDTTTFPSCKLMGYEMEDLRAKRQSVLSEHKAAQWRAYQMKEKSKAMAKDQSSLEARLEICKNGVFYGL